MDGLLLGKRYLILDRGSLFAVKFQDRLRDVGIRSVKLLPRSANLNAHAERFVWTIKESCLERLILFGEVGLRKAIRSSWHITIRNGVTNGFATASLLPRLICRCMVDRSGDGSDLGGMLNYYHR